MKKLLLASLITFSSALTFAASPTTTKDTTFAQIEENLASNNFTAAYHDLDRLAKTGNAKAIYGLGLLTGQGQGIAKDEAKAVKLFEQSANLNYAPAQYALGYAYLSGQLGLKADRVKAKGFLEKAAKQLDEAGIDLAMLLLTEPQSDAQQKGMKILDGLIQKQNPKAVYTKAMYQISLGVNNKSEATVQTGLDTLSNLAERNYIPALMAVARIMAEGQLVNQDLGAAQKIFNELANNQVPAAAEALKEVNQMISKQAQNITPTKATASKKSS